MNRIYRALRAWYSRGLRVDASPPGAKELKVVIHYDKPHWTALVARAIVEFHKRHWKWAASIYVTVALAVLFRS